MSRFLSESRVPKPLTPFAEPSKACAQLIGIPYSKHPPLLFFYAPMEFSLRVMSSANPFNLTPKGPRPLVCLKSDDSLL